MVVCSSSSRRKELIIPLIFQKETNYTAQVSLGREMCTAEISEGIKVYTAQISEVERRMHQKFQK